MVFESEVRDAQATILLEKEDGYTYEYSLYNQIALFLDGIFSKFDCLKSHSGQKLFIRVFISDCDIENAAMITNSVKSGLLEICKQYNN